MEYAFKLTVNVKKFMENSTNLVEIGIGCSDSQIIEIEKANEKYYLKMAKKGLLINEYNNLKWLDGKLNVPEVVLYDITDETEFLITKAIPGEMVCSDYYIKNPQLGIPIIVESFRDLYAIDISNCPFDVSLKYKLSLVRNNLDNGLIDIQNVDSEVLKEYGSLEGIYKYLVENVFDEELCFSHGDMSLPNIFANNKKFSGFIDVGECGIADKWFDIAIATRSIIRNYGKEYLVNFYQQLNVNPDKFKIKYYLLIMELYL